MKRIVFTLLTTFSCLSVFSQSDWKDKVSYLAKHTFTPALEVGYVWNNSKELLNSIMFKGAAEYRFNNLRGPVIRGNYDTYYAKYQINNLNNLARIVKGTAFFSDIMLGGGYRIGNLRHRCFGLLQGGVKWYDYPEVSESTSTIEIRMENQFAATGRVTLGYEFYVNERSAFTLEGMHSRVFERKHYWKEDGGSWALSFGFTTSLN